LQDVVKKNVIVELFYFSNTIYIRTDRLCKKGMEIIISGRARLEAIPLQKSHLTPLPPSHFIALKNENTRQPWLRTGPTHAQVGLWSGLSKAFLGEEI
jgi:hypothetical protein